MSERFTPYKAERIEIPQNFTLYQINTDMGSFFTACFSEEALFETIIDKMQENCLILSVNKIRFDGSRPRVAVKTEKRFKDFLKSYKKVLCTQTYIEDNNEFWTEGRVYNARHVDGRWLIETNFGNIGCVGEAYMLDDFEAYFELCKEVK